MQLQAAREMLRCNYLDAINKPVQWADLGCGAGLFSHALASLLPAGSTLYAVDKENAFDKKISTASGTGILFSRQDFTGQLDLPLLDGVLMANSLHYVKDKKTFLQKMAIHYKQDAAFLLVEYDITIPVAHWVPYPVNYAALKELFAAAGFSSVEKLQERPSLYGRGNIYSALILKTS